MYEVCMMGMDDGVVEVEVSVKSLGLGVVILARGCCCGRG